MTTSSRKARTALQNATAGHEIRTPQKQTCVARWKQRHLRIIAALPLKSVNDVVVVTGGDSHPRIRICELLCPSVEHLPAAKPQTVVHLVPGPVNI